MCSFQWKQQPQREKIDCIHTVTIPSRISPFRPILFLSCINRHFCKCFGMGPTKSAEQHKNEKHTERASGTKKGTTKVIVICCACEVENTFVIYKGIFRQMPLPLPFDGVRCSGAYFIHENVIIQLLYKDTGYKSGINALIFTYFQSLWPNKKSPTVCQLSWHCYSHRVPMLCQKHFSNQIENSTREMLNSQWKTYQLLYVPSYFDDFVFVPPTLFVYHKHTLLQSILSVAAQTKMMMKKKRNSTKLNIHTIRAQAHIFALSYSKAIKCQFHNKENERRTKESKTKPKRTKLNEWQRREHSLNGIKNERNIVENKSTQHSNRQQ